MIFNLKTDAGQTNSQWTYIIPKLNSGKESIDDMSLIAGMYENYIVTKTGYLVSIIETSGINVDLLSKREQEDLFDAYNTFLISSLGSEHSISLEFIESTLPVNMEAYLLNLKRQYIREKRKEHPNVFKIRLIVSYIEYYLNMQSKKDMATKKHLTVICSEIKGKTYDNLKIAESDLTEKVQLVIRNLENSFSDFDMQINILTAHEVLYILKTFINQKS